MAIFKKYAKNIPLAEENHLKSKYDKMNIQPQQENTTYSFL